jgi:diguanylate cyclase (GGDEF)-like protein
MVSDTAVPATARTERPASRAEDREPTPDQRDTARLRRLRYLIYGSFAVLVSAVLIAVFRAPRDPLTLAELVATIGLALGLAARHEINRRHIARHSERQAGEASILQGMSRSVSADAIVDAIVNALRRSADADHVAVARLRPVERVVETMLVSSRAMVPPSRSVLPHTILEPDGSRQRSRKRGRSLVVGGDEEERAVAESVAARLAETYALSYTLAAPLVTDKQMVGALILSRRQQREWSAADRRLLAFSAEELSAALARAFAFEEADIRANIDALTGLPNRRYLQEALAAVGPRRRSGDRLGALMIDLDHFKRLNDRYGHAAGDRVLRLVGERISAAVRADDTPARYGGEEFAVLLRRADPQQAVEVAERIRRQIGEMTPHELGIGERLTVSIGVAVAESHVGDPGALLQSADEALYRAKREGRNRVVLAA